MNMFKKSALVMAILVVASAVGYGTAFGYGSSSHRRSTTSGAPVGQVLGAETGPDSCQPYLTADIWANRAGNDVEQVKKLQQFLNEEVAAGLPITGFYGPMTRAAVNKFQLKYADKVLAPWVSYGLPSATTPTGNVYKTTRAMINQIKCPQANTASPQLP